MVTLSSISWYSGVLFLLGGFLFIIFTIGNREVNVQARVLLGLFTMLIGMLLCLIGNKLKDTDGETTSRSGKPDEGWPGRPWYRTDPKYDDMMAHR